MKSPELAMTGQQQTNKRMSPPCVVSLPEDVVTDLLLLLPARSLARFRCVCRSWNAQISSRSYQDSYQAHHALATSTKPKLAFLPMAPEPCMNNRPWCKGCPRLVCAKPCRGLVLVERRCGGNFSVCNLSTSGILHLPPPPRADVIDDDVHSAGIGFHAPTGQYKVVNLRVDCVGRARCNVLSLSSDDEDGYAATSGTWSSNEAGDQFLTDGIFVNTDVNPVFADGCLHWMFRTVRTRHDEPHGILSFSLANETFRRAPQPYFSTTDFALPPPPPPMDIWYKNTSHRRPRRRVVGKTSAGDRVIIPVGTALAELDGSLCIVRDVRRCNEVGLRRLFEIWKLQDYEAGSWSMDYSISQPAQVVAEQLRSPWFVIPVCYFGNRRKVVLVTSAHQAHVYDPDTDALHTVASLAARGGEALKNMSSGPFGFLRLVLHQESLAQFYGMDHDAGEIKFLEVPGVI
ncbi:hypothetical protein ACQ4PT_071338 [Festuca glaucescens]